MRCYQLPMALMLLFALHACGGGGSDGAAVPPPPASSQPGISLPDSLNTATAQIDIAPEVTEPIDPSLSYSWSVLSGPAPIVHAIILDGTGRSRIHFPRNGIYELLLHIDDGHSTQTVGPVRITVDAGDARRVVLHIDDAGAPAPAVTCLLLWRRSGNTVIVSRSTNAAGQATFDGLIDAIDQYDWQVGSP